MCVLLIKVRIRKKSRNLFNDPRTYLEIKLSQVSNFFLVMITSFGNNSKLKIDIINQNIICTHRHIFTPYIYIYVKLLTFIESDPKAPF